jgi:outer membrane protein insertion porin family
MYSLRGYDYRDVGPRDEYDEPIGGGTYWFGSAEYSIPIIERLRFAVFYDIGMVYYDAYSFDRPSDLPFFNDDVGAGIRLNLPIGPLRLDYGIPVSRDPGRSSSGKFQFGVGYTREF